MSCGCLAKEKLRDYNQQKEIDEIGNRYGRLVVLSRNYDPKEQRDGRAMWNCKCDCGNEVVVSGKCLREGHTHSCGCLVFETSSRIGKITGPLTGGKQFKDITGQHFGNLTVIKRVENTKGGQARWECECICGTHIVVLGAALQSGNTQSCGCLRSKGELKIGQLLIKDNINFSKEYHINYKDKFYKFDFAIFNQNQLQYLIEYDGIQHFENVNYFGEDSLQNNQQRDNAKNQWCKDNNIPLIRIPYTHLKNLCIDDLKLETTKFRVI